MLPGVQNHWVAYEGSTHEFKGRQLFLEVNLAIEEGYHIQDDAPADPYLIPTSLEVILPEGWKLERIDFPPSEGFLLSGSETPLQVYSETVVIRLIIAAQGTAAGKIVIPATLRYQACDKSKCYYPRELEFEIDID